MKIGVIVAMEKELHQIRDMFPEEKVVVQKCGIGKVNAAIGATEMIRDHQPDMIVSTGCAGGSVYGQVQGMPARFPADPKMLEAAQTLTANLSSFAPGISIHPGLIVTGDWFVDSKEKMREIIGHFPEARAIDMESAAIAHACYRKGVPFISFRVISDLPLQDVDASMYHDFWNTIADNSFQVTRHFLECLMQSA